MKNSSRPILVTGAAGFIGAALVKKLLKIKEKVIGLDNMNSYYDISLKKARLNDIEKNLVDKSDWQFHQTSLEDLEGLKQIFETKKPRIVVNLAAQAGVRYSIDNPYSYVQSNLLGFGNILELCRNNYVDHLVYASSSSVYGGNTKLPFDEKDSVNHPVSFYAATKRANELMAHSYSHLYNLPATGLRFFTVYGPWGRPDMAPMIFARSILLGEKIKVFNYGRMKRDFTFVDDISEALMRCCFKPATSDQSFDSMNPDPQTSNAPHRIFNIGNNQTVDLLYFIELLEKSLGSKAIKDLQPIQSGDVMNTFANTTSLDKWIGFKPSTSIEEGVILFCDWFRSFYGI